jgi:dTDP-4-amino-4,6-dideoxygalactose transaminase
LGAVGDAGAIVTNDINLAEKAKMISNHGQLNIKHSHKVIGRNSRLDSIQASVLSVKLRHLDEWNQKRINAAMLYKSFLHKKEGLVLPETENEKKHVFHLFVIKCKNRIKLIELFEKNNVSFGIHYPKALPFLEAYQYLNHSADDFPIASRVTDDILSLPIYPELAENQIELICNLILDTDGL